jgi:hypothetical protein
VGASALRVVESVGAVWWRVVFEPVVHGCGLVVGEREDVAEASARVDDCFTRLFGLGAGGEGFGDVCVVFDLERRLEVVADDMVGGSGTVGCSFSARSVPSTYLCGSHGRDVRACAWEAGVEFARGAISVSAVAWCDGLIDALASVASDTVISR